MKKTLTLTIFTATAIFIGRNWIQSAPLQSGAPPAAQTSFRVVFGALQERGADYSGSVSISDGKVVSVAPWRFFGGDAVQGSGTWKLTIKRSVLETQPDQPRALTSQGQIPILVPAGVTVTLEEQDALAPPLSVAVSSTE